MVALVSRSAAICAVSPACTAWIDAVSFKSLKSTVLVLPFSKERVRMLPLRLKSVMFWSSVPILFKEARSTLTVLPSALVRVRISPERFASVRSSLLALVSRSAKTCASKALCTAAIAAESLRSARLTTTEPPFSKVRLRSLPLRVKLWSCWLSVPVPDKEDRSTVIVFPSSILRFNVVPVRLKS